MSGVLVSLTMFLILYRWETQVATQRLALQFYLDARERLRTAQPESAIHPQPRPVSLSHGGIDAWATERTALSEVELPHPQVTLVSQESPVREPSQLSAGLRIQQVLDEGNHQWRRAKTPVAYTAWLSLLAGLGENRA